MLSYTEHPRYIFDTMATSRSRSLRLANDSEQRAQRKLRQKSVRKVILCKGMMKALVKGSRRGSVKGLMGEGSVKGSR